VRTHHQRLKEKQNRICRTATSFAGASLAMKRTRASANASTSAAHAVSHVELAAMVHNYLAEHGFARALREFQIEATSLLRTFPRGVPPRGTKDLRAVLSEYVVMKEREAARERAGGVVKRMLAVIDDALPRLEDDDENNGGTRMIMNDDADDSAVAIASRRDNSMPSRAGVAHREIEREILAETPTRVQPSAPAVGNRRKPAPKRFVPGQGPTATGAAPSSRARTPMSLGTLVARSPPTSGPPRGSLRPFTLPEQIQNAAVQQKMADVIVNAFGGRGKLKTTTYTAATANNNRDSFLDEEPVDNVMNSLLEEDGELGDFLYAMMSEVETQRGGSGGERDISVHGAFGSPTRRTPPSR